MSARGRSVSTWAIIRTTRGIEPAISSSRAHSSGTSPKPSRRAAYAGNSETRSEVAVKMTEMKSSTSRPLDVHHVGHHLGDPLEHVLARRRPRAGSLPAPPDRHADPSLGHRTSGCRRADGAATGREPRDRSCTGSAPSQAGARPAGRRARRAVSSRELADSEAARAATGPIAVRVSRRTGWPTWSSSRRTIRLRPSWMTSSTIDRARRRAARRSTILAATTVDRAVVERRRPSSSCLSVALVTSPSTSATYVLSTSYDGCAMRWAKSPSLVSRISPEVSVSSRPTWKSRSGRSATRSDRVRRPSRVGHRRDDAARLVEDQVDVRRDRRQPLARDPDHGGRAGRPWCRAG